MTFVVTPVTLPDLTTATVGGTGVFDVLMRATKAHLDEEFTKNRLRGPEYSTVYLGALQSVMSQSMQFLLQKDKTSLEAMLVEQQILLAQAEVTKANAVIAQIQAQTALAVQQTANALAELAILQANALKVPAEVAHIQAQTAMVGQQKTNLIAEALNLPKQGLLLDAQKDQTVQKTLNAVTENDVLLATKCKLQAEYDLVLATKLKADQEVSLLAWKVTTEKAQTTATGVDDNSVVGKQKLLYGAQTAGFSRDAEQKAADLLIKTWNTRRMTDDTTIAGLSPLGGVDNGLGDANVARAVTKLLSGVGA
jgi:hypothetical protein